MDSLSNCTRGSGRSRRSPVGVQVSEDRHKDQPIGSKTHEAESQEARDGKQEEYTEDHPRLGL